MYNVYIVEHKLKGFGQDSGNYREPTQVACTITLNAHAITMSFSMVCTT